jgi:Spy/CpxP family protein refolding chaperone
VRFRGRWLAKGAAFVVLALALVAALSFVVMSLWNALVPSLFHGPTVQFWQAVGLLLLSRILFGGFRGRGGHGWHGRSRWRERMWRQHWQSLTPEERERLRAKYKQTCGWNPEAYGSTPEQPEP